MKALKLVMLIAVTVFLNAVLYLAFASNAGGREIVAAMLTGGIAAAAAVVFARAGNVRFQFRLRES